MSGMKAKKKPAPPPYDPARAKGFIERVARLMSERKEVSESIADVCVEAKSHGLEPAFVRFAASESLMDDAKRSERNEKREMYLRAVGLAVEAVRSGEMSAREAAKAYGVGKTNVYKLMAVREVSAHRDMTDADLGDVSLLIPHDPNTGEIHESSGSTEGRAASGQHGEAATADAGPISEAGPMAKATAHSASAAGIKPGPLDTPFIDHAAIEADTLEIPACLKRERAPA